MRRSSNFFRPVPIDSPVHRMAAESKVLAGIFISIGLVFNTEWSHIGVAALLVFAAFRASNLPLSVLPRVPVVVQFALFGGLLGSIFSNEPPKLGAISLGALSDYARLISIGFLMILWVGILAWTTGLTSVGFALRRLISPLRFLRIPVDEIGSVIALAVRSLPLVADEIDLVNETITSRPSPVELSNKPIRDAFALIGDTSTAVVIGSHRRARDLSMAMVSRGSTTAPPPPPAERTRLDVLVAVGAFVLCVAAFVVPGYPENSPDPLPSVRGVVFEDTDGDGQRDDDEPRIADMTVELLAAETAGNSDIVVDSFTTSERGGYVFLDIEPGTYVVRFVPPEGRTFVEPDQGDDERDSDPDPGDGRSEPLELMADEIRADEIETLDAGLAPPNP